MIYKLSMTKVYSESQREVRTLRNFRNKRAHILGLA